MTDLPIIMSAPMIRATLREIEKPGTGKTNTRRLAWRAEADGGPDVGVFRIPSSWQRVKAGDRLWVRENAKLRSNGPGRGQISLVFKADDSYSGEFIGTVRTKHPFTATRWTPSIHMPRWASRLTLIVIGMKIERLQDISEEDARAEGIELIGTYDECDGDPRLDGSIYAEKAFHWDRSFVRDPSDFRDCHNSAKGAYRLLWNILHGPGSWDTNPEVVAITFRPVLANINSLELANAPQPGGGEP